MRRSITIFTLVMINLAAMGSSRSWAVIAEYGFSSITYLLLAAVIFFIPVALVAAELATGWPESGGVFVWVKQAFGHRTGFLAIWLLWIENVIWYPILLSFLAATIAYIINPSLASSIPFTLGIILASFWLATITNLLGMNISGWISSIGVIFGTFIPGALIILLGLIWYFMGKPLQITVSWDALVPNLSSVTELVFFTGIILFFCGIEMSAIHAKDVRHPQKDYPKAILFSGIVVIGMSILGVLSIASIIPQTQISLVAGSMQAFAYFFHAYNLQHLTPWIAALVAIGVFGSLSTWIMGCSKGLLAAAKDGDLPPYFRAVNKQGVPTRLLIFQALFVTILSLIFVFMPTISSAFWILTAIVTQLYLIMYVLMFAAAIKLRYKRPDVPRAYQIPGKKPGIWLVCGLGILSSIFAFFIGFFPPAQIPTGNVLFYVLFLAVGIILACLAPAAILLFQKPHWKEPLSHEKTP